MHDERDDPDARHRQQALFRHAIIGELDIEALPRGERSARIAALATRSYRTPEGRERRFSVRTLWAWWSAYRQHGLEGLLPKRRQDRGTLRALSPDVLDAAIALRREVPSRSTATLIDILETAGRIVRGQLRRATLDRHLAHAGVTRRRLRTLGDKRYIRLLFERPNQFWVGDYHEAPLLWDPARQRYRTLHLCVGIDHFSKLVPHGEWYATEQIATLDFQRVYDEFHARIRRYLARVGGTADADDLTQETFARVSQSLVGFRGEATLATWIYRIATNVALDRARSRGVQIQARAAQPNALATLGTTPLIEQDIARREMSACVRDHVDRLPADYRTVVVLGDLEELPDWQIAEVLGIRLEAAKIRLHRARARLREMLGEGCDFSRDERNEFICEPS